MNKTDVKFKEIRTLDGQNLGDEVESFLREDIELIGMQVYREDNEKVAYITYVNRKDVSKKYEESGRKFEEYMYANYYHAIEVSVPRTKNLAEKIEEEFTNNPDMEKMNEFYFLGNNTRNALILYASRSEVEANEEAARIAQQKMAEEMAGVKADELAENGIKDPDINRDETDLDEYASKIEEEKQPEITDENVVTVETVDETEKISTPEESTTKKKQK